MLVFVLFIGLMPPTAIKAASLAELCDFQKSDEKSVGMDMKLTTPDSDESTVKWEFQEAGKYTLDYYVQDTSKTKKIELEFNVSGTNAITLAAQMSVEGTNQSVNIKQHNAPYSDGEGWTEITDPTNITGLMLNGSKIEETELSLMFEDKYKVRIKIDKSTIMVTVDGIKAGYITPFNLTYTNVGDGSTIPLGTMVDFKGFEQFDIKATHLTGSDLQTTYLTSYPEEAGTKPGIKVTIARPYYINGNKFEVMNDAEGSKLRVSLALWPEFTLDQKQAASSDDNLNLQFNLGAENEIGSTGKSTHKAGDNIEIYLNQEDIGSSYVILWDNLKESSVIGGNIQAIYSYTTNDGTQRDVLGEKLYNPDNKGYTFLKYSASKTGEEEVELSVTPYNMNSNVIYTVYRKRVDINNNPNQEVTISDLGNMGNWIKELEYIYSKGDSAIQTIPIAISKAVEQEYIITAQLENQTVPFISQRLYFNPTDIQAPPKVTQIVNIDNLFAIPGQSADETLSSAPVEAVGFDLEWNAPKLEELVRLLSKGDLYYELLVRNTKDETEVPKVIKTFKVSPEDRSNISTSSQIKVEAYLGAAGGEEKTGEYYTGVGTFKMPEVILKQPKQAGWERIDILESYPYKDSTSYPSAQIKNDIYNEVPGTYYFSMRTILVTTDGKVIGNTDESNLKAASLDIVSQVLPTVSNISGSSTVDGSKITESISFSGANIKTYVDKMLEPAGWKLDAANKYKGEYEIFLYTLKDAESKYTESDFNKAVESGTVRKFQTDTYKLSTSDLDQLRNNKIVVFNYSVDEMDNNKTIQLNFENLDPNQVYYISIRTKVHPFRTAADGSTEYQNPENTYSVLSAVFSFTTTTKPMPPSPEDSIPPSPEKFIIFDGPKNNSVTLGYQEAKLEKEDEEDEIYYEIVRSEGIKLTEEQKENKVEIKDLVEENEDIVGFDTKEANIRTITYEAPNWTEASPQQASSKIGTKDDEAYLLFADIDLSPNNIYYYYIRTAYITNGVKVNSSWLLLPVTTSPVAAPKNLKVESYKDYDYDTKRETVISFDAPIPEGADIPKDYEFEIAVKGEKDTDYTITKYSTEKISTGETDEEGYTHYVYKIEDLDPNTRYDIKVRIRDKTQKIEPGEEYPTSLYCDKVSTRTDYDEKYQQGQEKYEEYIKKFDNEVNKIKTRPYWVVEEDSSYKYRESYINTEIALSDEYELVVGEDAKDVYYYLPAAMFKEINRTKTTLKVKLDSNVFYIRPNTLTEENEEIEEVLEAIDDGDIEDYYIGVSITTRETSESINGETNVSPKLSVDMEVLYMKQLEEDIETAILEKFADVIDKRRDKFISKLESKVDKGKISDDELQEIIDDSLADIDEDLAKAISKILDKQQDDSESINAIQKAILITTQADCYSVNGYYESNSTWLQVTTYSVGNGFGLEANVLGTYIFTGQKSLIDTAPEIAPYQSMISKYNLTDFFTLDSYMINTAVTKDQLYGAVARVMGAARGTDYKNYLKNNGIQGVAVIGTNGSVRQDETIYIIMQAYEKRYNKPITAIAITNRQSVQNIGAFQQVYRNYIYAAVQLGIVTPDNGRVLPSKQLSVKEFLKMLYIMQSK